MVALSDRTRQLMDRLFAPADQAAVADLLTTECADKLPFHNGSDSIQLERLRFAALKCSGGDIDRLLQAVALAQTDWRDLLMNSGFGHSITEHDRWADALLNTPPS